MHRFVWALQLVFGFFFVWMSVNHFTLPDDLPGQMSWMYAMPEWLHLLSGTAELAGGLGLILPGLTGVKPNLTHLAAFGLALTMIMASLWHMPRGNSQSMMLSFMLALILAVIGFYRWAFHPLKPPDPEENQSGHQFPENPA